MGRTAAHDSRRLHCRGNCRGRFGLLPVATLMRSDRFISSRTTRSMRSRATSGPDSSESAPLGDGTRTLWRPLRTPLFRNLLIADAMSDVGTFMQAVGAAWLMVSLGAGPMYVALTQTASALPFFVFALPAGAIGDIVDRRRLIPRKSSFLNSSTVLCHCPIRWPGRRCCRYFGLIDRSARV